MKSRDLTKTIGYLVRSIAVILLEYNPGSTSIGGFELVWKGIFRPFGLKFLGRLLEEHRFL